MRRRCSLIDLLECCLRSFSCSHRRRVSYCERIERASRRLLAFDGIRLDLACGEEGAYGCQRRESDITRADRFASCVRIAQIDRLHRVVRRKVVHLSAICVGIRSMLDPMHAVQAGLDQHLGHRTIAGIISRIILDLIKQISIAIIYGQLLIDAAVVRMESAISDLEDVVKRKISSMAAPDIAGPADVLRIWNIQERIILRRRTDHVAPFGISILIHCAYAVRMRRSVFQTSMREARAACQDALQLISRNIIAWHSVYEHLIGIRILDCIPLYRDARRRLRFLVLAQHRCLKIRIELCGTELAVVDKAADDQLLRVRL